MPDRPSRRAKPVRSRPDSPVPTARGALDFPIVAIGASAGGLDACRQLVRGLSRGVGMAFILIQHLDPTHESMMVDLLADHTSLVVRQAAEGMRVERDHLYIIPPGVYLSVRGGSIHLSEPEARHGARLPFDFLLNSLAAECGARTLCVILSGTGGDGSVGLKSVKEAGGFVIAQSPEEAAYDGMPRSAIATGGVDVVLPVAEMPDALAARGTPATRGAEADPATDEGGDRLLDVIKLLRTKTVHDFTLYKRGTLRRRIERRMSLAAVRTGDMGRYLEILRQDGDELNLLAKDLLINVTGFFRDAKVFDFLAESVVPELVRSRSSDGSLRVWIPGCSTGEETYSLAMLLTDAIAAAKSGIKLQVFASDIDPDALASAREGFYPEAIEADVSPDRLARFFSKEDHGYRVRSDLRGAVVFSVQDVLADPPFSRLDLVSCRNLFIYLQPEAQNKVVSLFHFALRKGGLLLLGNAETVGDAEGRFEVVSEPERLYRQVGQGRPGAFAFPATSGERGPAVARGRGNRVSSKPATVADLCQRLVLQDHAPASVMINARSECLYSLGPTERYLHVAPGAASHDLLAMIGQNVRAKLRAAIRRAGRDGTRVTVRGGRASHEGRPFSFSIDVQPVSHDGEQLLLVCFVDDSRHDVGQHRPLRSGDAPRVVELERDLVATRTELESAISSLELLNEEQKTVNEEALSLNEEYQSTNEELLASQEEYQSLNEELTALNGQLEETLERQRTTSNDLQNILYSTDVATVFLDTQFNIRFFTPATKALFSIIASDVGRPLGDLRSLADDDELMEDARTVLRDVAPLEREIEAASGFWYIRRILTYRTQESGVDGVVITFVDITERKHIADALEEARRQAQLANVAKSRFLSAASHDLRQPLQTLTLLQGLLAETVRDEKARNLVTRLDETLGSMSGILNTLLDINQIEAGVVRASIVTFPVQELLGRVMAEFGYHAQAQAIGLRVVPCGASIRSDPRLLEQVVRNLLSNALKYTRRGKVLLGCRRRAGTLSIEVWDTGVGIPEGELRAIFDEYHQLDTAVRDRSHGLGLGLAIVDRLSDLMGHRVRVRSNLGKGSMFAIDILHEPGAPQARGAGRVSTGSTASNDAPLREKKAGRSEAMMSVGSRNREDVDAAPAEVVRKTGRVLWVEDDAEVRELVELLLKNDGHRTATAAHADGALALVGPGAFVPDLILSDYNLPNGMTGVELAIEIRQKLDRQIPVIILTGDISTDALRGIAGQRCTQLNKPVRPGELKRVIQDLLSTRSRTTPPPASAVVGTGRGDGPALVYVVDDDDEVREAIRSVLEEAGRNVESYPTCEAFLEAYRADREACLLVDAYLPGMSGVDLLRKLRETGHRLPSVMITGNSDVAMAVRAMKAGALDFVEKPLNRAELLASVERALEQSRDWRKLSTRRKTAADHIASLTRRQRQVMDMVLAGNPSKNIAADLGISQRTVENHRASVMKKTGVKSLADLARMAMVAAPPKSTTALQGTDG